MNTFQRRLLLLILVISVVIGCSSCVQLLFGVKGKVKEKDAHAIEVLGRKFGVGSSRLLDSSYRSRVKALDQPKDVHKALLQPLQFWLYKDGKLSHAIVNCYADVRFLNLNWQLDSVGVGASPMDTAGFLRADVHFQLLSLDDVDTNGGHAVVIWTDYMGRQNRHFLKSVKKYLTKNPAVDPHYINADNVFLE